ncbi:MULTISPECIES: MarR family winged helix-turn-helix transcriptional regulator [Paenibacillus]|uniref:MarR family winged helix-turn-helix transcriptional regulator n=1 Tax=Paenibacillus vandeheii TaxID=3035917 RepID=A0ABT8JJU1_9BACL|nr:MULTISPECIES: MarR family winged helix-turn-helix transcriptional regulator [Paenibacillus]KGP77757.1 MarR family transcriptional regulator [Paenibacillus sp. MAEPY2]KGP78265.1 MarR family transcriptional regulator [Paenibacillus sp. MAEPY1]MDN4605395.1 MarR family winged helix-turn-helix transcriptional regulator [Paenibacillus vandeheii]OMF61343.1 MarR family transcriptional regulator [Paenibacillus sp. FSL R5-0765]
MENVRELFQIMTRRFGLLNKNCCTVGAIDVSPAQSHILYEVDRQHNPSMQQIADTLGTDITTFSRQVQSLVKLKLLNKTPDSTDRRVYLLSLTTEGKFVATTIDQQMSAYLDEIFSHMSGFEKEMVINSIKLLNKAMLQSDNCCQPVKG